MTLVPFKTWTGRKKDFKLLDNFSMFSGLKPNKAKF